MGKNQPHWCQQNPINLCIAQDVAAVLEFAVAMVALMHHQHCASVQVQSSIARKQSKTINL